MASNNNNSIKRGAFLPRGDLTNKSPEDEDDDNSTELIGGIGGSSVTMNATSNNKPPQPPLPLNKRKQKNLPVKSSGYGRPNSSNSSSTTTSSSSSLSSSRPSTPSQPQRRPTTNNSYTASSPAAAAANYNPTRSSSTSTTTSRLRHGDGTLVQSVIGSVTKFKKNRAALLMNGGVHSNSNSGSGNTRSMRSRSPSPARGLNSHGHATRDTSRVNTNGSAIKRGKMGSNRSRTPSPVVKQRTLSRQHANGIMNGSGMKRKTRSDSGMGSSGIRHCSSSPSPLLGSSIYNDNDGDHFNNIDQAQEQQQQQQPSQYKHKDYSYGTTLDDYDADPTPVKEARRLSSIFHNRASTNNIGIGNQQQQAMMGVLLEDPVSPVARTKLGEGAEAPLSYSKVLKKGLASSSSTKVATAAASAGVSSPISAMKLFQPSSNTTTNNSNTTSTSSISSLFEGFTNPKSSSQITTLSTQLFSRSSGIDTPNIQHLLSNSYKNKDNKSKTHQQWELRKRLESKEEDLAIVRTALQDLLVGKDSFVLGAIQIEQGWLDKFIQVKGVYEQLLEEKCTLQTLHSEDQKDMVTLKKELDGYKIKCELLTSDNDEMKVQLATHQQSSAEHAKSHAVLESKLQELARQKDEAFSQISQLELEKQIAVKEVETTVRSEMNEKLCKIEKEKQVLQEEIEVRKGWEQEVCQLMNVNVSEEAVVDATDDDGAPEKKKAPMSFMETIRQRVHEYQNDIKTKDELEQSLESCMMELDKAEADYQAALEAATAKDRDMSELMKSIGDIQRSGQERELDAANQRKAAEDRATAAESQVAECREQLLSLGYEKKSLEDALETAKAACSTQQSTIANLQKEISDSKIETVQHDSQLQLERDLRAKAEEKEADERAERVALAAQLNAQVQEHAQSEKQLRESMESMGKKLSEQIRAKEEESKMKEAELTKCKEIITALDANVASLKEALSDQKSMLETTKEEEIGRLKGEIAHLASKLKSEVEKLQSAGVVSDAKVHEFENIIRKGKEERKRMHNIIQELRGNVRVFARIRPFLPSDGGKTGDEEGTKPSVCPEGELQVTVATPNDPSQRHRFQFDRVFAPSAGQEAVFDEVSEFVQSSLDGYQVCLFSYGQTGSGKTFTMQGAGNDVMRGLIPRSIEQIASHKTQLKKDAWSFSMEISFLEIYNETLKDLLRDNPNVEAKHEIKVGSDGRRKVTNLTVKQIDPNDREAVEAVLTLAAKRRSTAATDMNATSSRSHSVFTLNMTAKHEEQNKVVRGTLNLVDLAGSERLDRSNARGQQAKEAVAINKSLSSLADVFTAIGQKQSHVPFRNSRLTYLLQPALSGEGKTCMLVNISPTEQSVQESLCSLRFASKVNKCELGKAKRTIEEAKSDGAPKRNASNSKSSAATSRSVKRRHV